MLHYIAAAVSSTSGSAFADTFYYILASLALVAGFLTGMWRFLVHQKKKWIREGTEKAEAIRVQRENSEQLKANTEAISKLTGQMGEFIASVHSQLDGLGKRVSRLEFFQSRREKEEP